MSTTSFTKTENLLVLCQVLHAFILGVGQVVEYSSVKCITCIDLWNHHGNSPITPKKLLHATPLQSHPLPQLLVITAQFSISIIVSYNSRLLYKMESPCRQPFEIGFVFFTQHNAFKIHPNFCVCHQLIPFFSELYQMEHAPYVTLQLRECLVKQTQPLSFEKGCIL